MKVESAQAAYAANTQPLAQAQQVEAAESAPATLEEDTLTLTQAGDGGASTNSGNSGGELPPRPPE